MFGKLSRMQLEKAASVTASAAGGKPQAGSGLREEEEINLYYRVGGKEAYLKSLSAEGNPVGVLEQYRQGRKYLLRESLESFEKAEDWDNVYILCRQALSTEDGNGKPSFLAFDMRVWKLFVKAASMKSNVEAYVPVLHHPHPPTQTWGKGIHKDFIANRSPAPSPKSRMYCKSSSPSKAARLPCTRRTSAWLSWNLLSSLRPAFCHRTLPQNDRHTASFNYTCS